MKVFYLSTYLLFVLLLVSSMSLAQDATIENSNDSTKVWKTGGSLNATFANVGLSNWAGGGQSSIALGTILNFNAKRTTDKSIWKNTAIFQFGMARVGKSNLNLFKKTDDNLQLDSKYGYKFNNKWSTAASLNFRTQVAPGYLFERDSLGKERQGKLISEFLAPGYLLTAVGIQYQNDYFSMRYSSVAAKFTFVMNDSLAAQGAFGVEKGENIRFEFGSNFDATLKYELMKNIQLLSTLNLFLNYQELTHIDVNWENLISFKVNRYVTTSFSTQLIYDHDVQIAQEDGTTQQAIQFKHVLNINFGYNF